MNLSKQSREVIEQIGRSIATLYAMQLTPLQILIMCEIRHREAHRKKGEHVFANQVRKDVVKLYKERGSASPPTRQAFWQAFDSLQTLRGMIYIAPHKKGTTKRAVALTANGAAPFEYPQSVHPYKPLLNAND